MRRLIRQRRTVAGDLTIVLVLIITIVILVFGFANYFLASNQAETGLAARAADMVDNLASVLAAPLWNVDTTAVTYLAETHEHIDDVVAVNIFAEDGEVIYDSELVDRTGLLMEQRPIYFEDQPVGSVEILFARQDIVELRNALWWNLGIITAVILAVIVVTHFLLRKLLSQPLAQLAYGLDTIAQGDYRYRVPSVRQVDIERIAQHANEMAAQIEEREKRLHDLIETLEQRVEQRTERLRVAAALSEKLNAILDTEQLLTEVVEQIKTNFNYYHVQIYLLDEAGEKLVVSAGAGEAGAQMKQEQFAIPLNAPTSLIARAARSGKIVDVLDVREVDDWLSCYWLPAACAEMAVPIIQEGQVIGVLDVQADEVGGLDEGDANLLRSLSGQLAVAFTNARLFQQNQAALQKAETLYASSQQMMVAKSLSDLIAIMVDKIAIPAIARAVLLTFNRKENGEIVSLTVMANWHNGNGNEPMAVGTIFPVEQHPVFWTILHSIHPLYFDDLQEDWQVEPEMAEMAQQFQIRALAAFPLWSQAKQLGAFLLLGPEPYSFKDEVWHPYFSLIGQLAASVETHLLVTQLEEKINARTLALEATNAALRERESQLKEAQHLARMGSWHWDLIQNQLHWSDEMYRVYGLQGNHPPTIEAVRRRIVDADHPIFDDAMDRMASGDIPGGLEYRIEKPDGDIRHLVARAEAGFNEAGEMVLLAGTVQDITVRKQAEIDLRHNEERLRTTLNSIGDAVIATDIAGDVVQMNRVAEVLTGWSAEEAVGKPLPEVFHIINAQTGETAVNPVNRVIESGMIVGLANHTVLLAKNGRDYQIADSAAPIRNTDNEITGVVLVFRDVTEEYRIQEALRDSEKKFRDLFENMQDAFALHKIILDEEGKPVDYEFLEVNSIFSQRLGMVAEDIVNKRVSDLFPETEQYWIDTFGKVALTGDPLVFTNYSGELDKYYETRVYSPQHGYFAALFTDVTTNRRYEKALQESEERFREFVEGTNDLVTQVDAQGDFIYVNHAAHEMFGLSPEECIGLSALSFIDKKDVGYTEQWFAQCVEDKIMNTTFENRQISKTGEKHDLIWTVNFHYDEQGEMLFANSIGRDITQRKRQEEEQMRQERLAAVGQLAAGIAHDFNNVMAVITLYSDLLQRTSDLSKKDLKKISIIHQQAEHAAKLTSQILDFSRRSVREPRSLDLKTLLNEMLKFIERTIPETIEIQFSFSRGDYTVNADPTQIQQVITNLTVNARDVMPQGGLLDFKLSCLTLREYDVPPCAGMTSGEWTKLAITDTGSGIAPETLPHIFEPFFSTKEVGQGTGLGLAQVYGIVQQHDGCITVESKVGEGTTFTIYLPTLTQETAVFPEPPPDIQQGDGQTILLVEDNPVLLEATSTLLKSFNYKVLTAVDGKDALSLYRQRQTEIDLIITDVVMPQMDGIDLVTSLQSYTPPPKVLLMSGFPRNKELDSELNQMIAGWLQKPMDLYHLAQSVWEALQR